MTKISLTDIRKEFLSFFSKENHDIISSSPLVPTNDDSLLFTNAGMVQFKNIFTGIENPPTSLRAVTSQKCVRAGGKHNDLENVGLTKRHHTFFEMLGNFSFGDYFKEDAIALAWDLITKNFSISPEKLIITVFNEDEEAYKIWKKVSSFDDSKILKISTSDNFWEMGDSGPCGPCSEIFYDHGEKYPGGLPGSEDEGDRFVEIWNLVFMQYNKHKDGKRDLLPSPSIDTGMGIERVAAVLQGKSDNYDIDLFRYLIEATKDIFQVQEDDKTYIPLRIISDHLRASCFLISDGVIPANEGRGYVLRRIMRRAIRQIYTLNIKEPSFYKLVPSLLNQMGEHYKELNSYKELISKTIFNEEEKFLETLEKGLKILEDESIKGNNNKFFSGKVAFKLYDTYGFPLDLTEDVLKTDNKKVNLEEFELEMKKQKELSKKSWKGETFNTDEKIWKDISNELEKTNFLGYEKNKSEAKILKIVSKGNIIEEANQVNEPLSLVLDKTPFYAEAGGQVGDTGIIKGENFFFEVHDTQVIQSKIYEHSGILIEGKIKEGDVANSEINLVKRKKIAANHSATHLLHSALRKKLGKHITQKGSLVSDEKLRFDISHNEKIDQETLMMIEKDINQKILECAPVSQSILKKDEAVAKGAMAIFGEKYGEEVRVIEMGTENNNTNMAYSIELCGGTHVKNTGEIGLFKFLSEGSLASGVRRIEAVTGMHALEVTQKIQNDIALIAEKLKTGTSSIFDRVSNLINEKKELEKKIKNINNSPSSSSKEDLEKINVNNYTVLFSIFDNKEAKVLKSISDKFLNNSSNTFIILISKSSNKVTAVIGISKDLENNFDAVELIRIATPVLGGKGGGGKTLLAQGGGTNPAKSKEAITKIIEYIKSKN